MLDLNAGALAPVAEEVTLGDLSVTGTLPPELDGTLIRNGPNPLTGHFDGNDMLSWWIAPAMLHGVTLQEGRATAYRNRWVRTGNWNRFVDPNTPADPMMDQNVNVNVLEHNNRLLALGEGGLPFEITAELDTLGPTNLGGALSPQAVGSVSGSAVGPGGMTAHPKVDPNTGEMCFFRADWQAPFLRYGVLDRAGNHSVDQLVDVPGPAMMHDFAITQSRAIFLDLPVAYDFSMLGSGAAIPLRWHDERPSRFGIMPRHGGDVCWVDVEPCFIQHIVNAYDVGPDVVVFDAVRYESFLRFDADSSTFAPNPLGQVWRYVIDLSNPSAPTVTEHQLSDHWVEMPRINEAYVGLPHRYAYAVEQPTDVEMRGIIKLDVDAGTLERHEIPAGDQNSEPIFVPRRPGGVSGECTAEDDGWVLTCVYRAVSDTTDVVVLDAQEIAADPVATIHLPHRIPAGFHGQWVPSR